MSNREEVVRDFAEVINRHSLENDSNTADFVLAEYVVDALEAFARGSKAREKWYGRKLDIEYASSLYTQKEFEAKFGKFTVTND